MIRKKNGLSLHNQVVDDGKLYPLEGIGHENQHENEQHKPTATIQFGSNSSVGPRSGKVIASGKVRQVVNFSFICLI